MAYLEGTRARTVSAKTVHVKNQVSVGGLCQPCPDGQENSLATRRCFACCTVAAYCVKPVLESEGTILYRRHFPSLSQASPYVFHMNICKTEACWQASPNDLSRVFGRKVPCM